MAPQPRTLSAIDTDLSAIHQRLTRLDDWARVVAIHASLTGHQVDGALTRVAQQRDHYMDRFTAMEQERSTAIAHISLLARGMAWAARHGRWETEVRLERRLLVLLGDAVLEVPDGVLSAEEERYVRAALRAGEAPRESCEVLIGEWLRERDELGRAVGRVA